MARLVVAVAVILTLGGCSGSDPAPGPQETRWLFVQSADSGRVTSRGDQQVLTLQGVSRATTTFTDRPERRSGQMSTRNFANSFGDLFGDEPPNADLSSHRVGKGEFTLELADPAYDAGKDTLTYTIKPIGKQGAALPERFGPVSLFIDDVGGSNWDTRLHMYSSTDGNVCRTNGFDGPLEQRVKSESDIINSPDTWMVKPTPGSDIYSGQYYIVSSTSGIMLGGQMAEGTNKNGPTTIVIDWTLTCGGGLEDGDYVGTVRTAASVPDDQFSANTQRCVWIDKADINWVSKKGNRYTADADVKCNSTIDSGFHTSAYFRFHVSAG